MTAQIPDTLKNNHPKVKFGRLSIHGIAVGDITKNHGWGEKYEMPILPNPLREKKVLPVQPYGEAISQILNYLKRDN